MVISCLRHLYFLYNYFLPRCCPYGTFDGQTNAQSFLFRLTIPKTTGLLILPFNERIDIMKIQYGL